MVRRRAGRIGVERQVAVRCVAEQGVEAEVAVLADRCQYPVNAVANAAVNATGLTQFAVETGDRAIRVVVLHGANAQIDYFPTAFALVFFKIVRDETVFLLLGFEFSQRAGASDVDINPFTQVLQLFQLAPAFHVEALNGERRFAPWPVDAGHEHTDLQVFRHDFLGSDRHSRAAQ